MALEFAEFYVSCVGFCVVVPVHVAHEHDVVISVVFGEGDDFHVVSIIYLRLIA